MFCYTSIYSIHSGRDSSFCPDRELCLLHPHHISQTILVYLQYFASQPPWPSPATSCRMQAQHRSVGLDAMNDVNWICKRITPIAHTSCRIHISVNNENKIPLIMTCSTFNVLSSHSLHTEPCPKTWKQKHYIPMRSNLGGSNDFNVARACLLCMS